MNASLLYEVPKKGGDQGPQGHQDEERSAGYTGRMSRMWDQSIPYREIEESIFYM
jgi:hypothetical protein